MKENEKRNGSGLRKALALCVALLTLCAGLLAGCGILEKLDGSDEAIISEEDIEEADAEEADAEEESVEAADAEEEDTEEADAEEESSEEENVEEEGVEEENTGEEIEKTEGDAGKNEVDFDGKLAELIAKYGIFNANQTGVMHQPDEKWFEPSGIMGAMVLDFDLDGGAEMLVAAAEDCPHYSSDYIDGFGHIVLYMYDVENGEIVQSDATTLGAYIQSDYEPTKQDEVILQPNYSAKEIIAVNYVPVNGNHYIVCENHYLRSAFGDGEKQCYWVLKYTNGMFRYVCSFTQMGEASGDFIYTGYTFEDGMCTKSDIYYNTQYGASNLYSDFGQAVAAFFSGYGIQMDSNAANDGFDSDIYGAFQSILSQGNDKTLFFELTNTMTAFTPDGLNNVAQYSATLRNGNGIPDRRE